MQHGLTPLRYTGYVATFLPVQLASLAQMQVHRGSKRCEIAVEIAFQQCASDEKRTFLLIKVVNGLCLLIKASGALCARPHLFFSLIRPSRRNVICYLDNVIFCLKK